MNEPISTNPLFIRQQALDCLLMTNPAEKVSATRALYKAAQEYGYQVETTDLVVPMLPGRPDKPELVAPRDLMRRRNSKKNGQAPLIHAICHIEFNAINLGLDAVARYSGMPDQYYLDWLRVAYEEANHFDMLSAHLITLGSEYGAFSAHNGMWEMAKKTHHDVLTRMALVPRVLEARGLDVTPGMMRKLTGSGDHKAVEILTVILREEVGHVKVGTDWFNYLCDQRGLVPQSTFQNLLETYFNGDLRGPFNHDARIEAGFTEAEMTMIEAQSSRS